VQFREARLVNGLEIIAECNERSYSTALGFFVKTGARDESAAVAGVSHFLEHMAFKGTPRRSAADVNRELDEIGSHSNAYTSEEQTVYYAAFLPEYLPQALDILSDMMRPSLRQDDFDTEKQVIIEEILKYEDQPPFGAHEKCMAAYFGSHPLGNSILGTAESVGGLTSDAMRGYFQQRYSPENIVLVATGRVNFEELIGYARACCDTWAPLPAPRDTPPAPARESFQTLVKQNATQEYAVQIAAGPSATDAERYASRILATIVGDDSGSRLFWELVDPGRAEYAGVGPNEFQGVGILMTFLSCAPERTAENLQRILQVQRTLEREGALSEELELASNKICSQLVRSSERPSNRLFSVGNGWIQRRSYQTVQERLAAYQRVTLADVNAILERFPLSRNTTIAVGPLDEVARPA
jgi:predicted Zn-dependent peptidase